MLPRKSAPSDTGAVLLSMTQDILDFFLNEKNLQYRNKILIQAIWILTCRFKDCLAPEKQEHRNSREKKYFERNVIGTGHRQNVSLKR